MNTSRIDIANMVLMVLAAMAAYVLPFEVFLFSYAVLGPLHYLTEISWLHQRGYFTTGKKDYYWLLIPCIILTIVSLVYMLKDTAGFNRAYEWMHGVIGPRGFSITQALIFGTFAGSLALVWLKDWVYKAIFLMAAFLVGFALMHEKPFIYIFGIFLPTLIHVFIFTGLFILYGALKNKSKTGYASLAVFVLCALSFFVWQPVFGFYSVSPKAQQALISSGFIQLNEAIIQLFNLGQYTREMVFQSPEGLGIMRFIAFAYTYHYLNWFSKTEVIKWHQVPRARLAAVVAIWLASVALYAYDYYVGLLALYFLSMLHVLLEFPLNYRSIIGIVEESAILMGWRKPVGAKKRKG
ncbi:MAG: hypothetical protein NZM35_02820 [Chitinophagales bacterium]|nr:hypothetical protein [Chitinophagales bacterium]MDW8418122.1 hypothetical protein [Chitinophagales bacterium]